MKATIHWLSFLFFMPALCLVSTEGSPDSVDLIIFSYHRPMQLYALLESLERNVKGLGATSVIYRADNKQYAAAYDEVKHLFSWVQFIKQGKHPESDFKSLLISLMKRAQAEYIMYAVDDIIVKEPVDLGECTQLLAETGAYGFYLRLGTNLTECYALSCKQPLPPLRPIKENIYAWTFGAGIADWGYPNTVDMTIYRLHDILPVVQSLSWTNPNTFEGAWAGHGAKALHYAQGLCYEQSKIVNLPLNIVQHTCNNRHLHAYSADELLVLFNQGLKLAIDDVQGMCNTAAHMARVPTLISREIRVEVH